MIRSILALAAATLAASPAFAATYSAKPASPAKAERIAVRDLVWACGPQSCTGSTQNSRPLVLCQGLAKRTGRLESFAVNGRPIAAAELERCNASAPTANDPALANAR
jgi:hypothetical protein